MLAGSRIPAGCTVTVVVPASGRGRTSEHARSPPRVTPERTARRAERMTVLYSRAVPARMAMALTLRRMACGEGCAARSCCAIDPTNGLVVEQDPARRGVDVIELPGAHRPHERGDRPSREQECEWEDQVQDGHGELVRVGSRNARDRSELASTVSELSGITAAAISGWIRPVTASAPATRL